MRLSCMVQIHAISIQLHLLHTKDTESHEDSDFCYDWVGVRMCEFCKNIYKSDYENQDYKDYIYKSEDGIFIHFTTGDSFMDFGYKINFCPMCGRELSEV